MGDRPRFQYSLRSLFWLMTGFAVLCSAMATCPKSLRHLLFEAVGCVLAVALVVVGSFLLVVVTLDLFSWWKTPDPDAGTRGKKLKSLLRLRCFWIGLCFTFPAAICLNLIPFYLTYGAYRTDGVERMGWPLTFYAFGGFCAYEDRSPPAFCADMLVAIALALFTGIGFRNGLGPVLAGARRLLHTIRTWPIQDET